MFESNQKVSVHIKETNTYKERCENYCNQYYNEHFEGKSSEEILLAVSSTPRDVVDSKIFKERICHLSKKEKSAKVALQSARDTIKALNENPSKENSIIKKLLVLV